MTEKMILTAIQCLLVLSILIIFLSILFYTRKRHISLFKRFFSGFGIGFITDLLDTMGIGSFATTTTLFKVTKMVDDDRNIPGTMSAAHAIPVMIEALCFISVVKVEMATLIPMAIASFLGALIGTRITKNWPTSTIQRILGLLLIIAGIVMVYRMITDPGTNNSTSVHGLHGLMLVGGICFNFIIGVLMTMGLGNYAPELIFFSLMGLNPTIAMPVMMLDAAMIMTASATQFIRQDRVSWNGFLGIVIGGIVGVLVAVKFLTSLNINDLKKFVVIIVILTGVLMIRSSRKKALKKRG